MRRFLLACTLAIACAFLSSCNESGTPLTSGSSEFPVERRLTDHSGRTIHASILGRDEKNITLERTSDQKRFVLPILRLSEKDRAYVRSLPISAPLPANRDSYSSPNHLTIKLNNTEIADLQRQYKDLETELQKYEYGTMKNRYIWKQMMEIQSEITKLKFENDRLR